MVEVVRAPAHLLLQDLGFTGFRKTGLPRCGAMDQESLIRGNLLVGNSPGEVGLEWALGAGALRFHSEAAVAITGAAVHGRVGQRPLETGTRMKVEAGTTLEIDRFSAGRFAYLTLSPPPDVPLIFGARSTYVPAKIGGFEGRRLKAGDRIGLAPRAAVDPTDAPFFPRELRPRVGILPGPQSAVLDGRLLDYLTATEFTISRQSDRTGYRLDGPRIDVSGLGQILSEPACEGSVQVTDSGTPIVLMADGPTIGGYQKVAVVLGRDLGSFAQRLPGEKVRFTLERE